MEANVWTQLFAQVVTCLSRLFASSGNQNEQANGGASPNAQGSAADSTSPSTNATTLTIARDAQMATGVAFFGRIHFGQEFVGYSMERIAVAIPLGSYEAHLEYSPHFQTLTPHIAVPSRTYIELHPANYPAQLEGCVAIGTTIENGALNSSRAAFDKLMTMLPPQFTVEIH